MNFFGGDNGPNPLTMAKLETEAITDMYNKMIVTCHKKCITNANSNDLAIGEMSCVDRCVGKYTHAQQKVQGVIQEQEQLRMQQAAGGVNTGPKLGATPK